MRAFGSTKSNKDEKLSVGRGRKGIPLWDQPNTTDKQRLPLPASPRHADLFPRSTYNRSPEVTGVSPATVR